MDPNSRTEQKHVVVKSPGQRSESDTERTLREPEKAGPSTGTIVLIAVLAVMAIGVMVYLVIDRNANVDVANQSNQQPPVVVQQPAPAQQPPVIIQQSAPPQQPPLIVQQPPPLSERPSISANDDANLQDIAARRLSGEPDMAAVVLSINDARAVLTGTVSSTAAKAKAEQLVKAVRGVKSVDNKIEVSS